MTTAAIPSPLSTTGRITRQHAAVLAVFTATLFLSALLLFSIQPIFAKMVLPQLGGSPSVWAVSLCFFQAALLAGYGYAHALNHFTSRQTAPLVHLGLLAVAALALPFGLPADTTAPAGDAYVWLLGVLTLGVGLPFFAVSANAPLLQSWFARSGHPHNSDPYFLYGASNLGSLLALLAYPFVVEPALGLADQAGVWTGGYLLLALMISACAMLVLAANARSPDAVGVAPATDNAAPVSWSRRLAWTFYAFVPSGLLVAFTSFVTTDIASAPFLWVTPLAAFLLTFVLVFRDKPLVPMHLLRTLQPFLVAGALMALALPSFFGQALPLGIHTTLFLVTMLVSHKQLYDLRPDSRHLTQFYLWMSLGGVLGGLFAALLAPQLFNNIYEYPLLVLLGLACRPDFAEALRDQAARRSALRIAALSAAGLGTLLVISWLLPDIPGMALGHFALLVATTCLIAERRLPLLMTVFAATILIASTVLPSRLSTGEAQRSFFGVVRIAPSPDATLQFLMHGSTIHGAERMADLASAEDVRPRPLTYYFPGSAMQKGVEAARIATGKTEGGLVVGAVGLGTGSMACASRPNESWRFYEIDPVIVRVALDPRHFNFLSRCRPDPDIVIGDARQTLAKEPDGKFDFLLIDAFSSDSVPVHMMTREAIAGFLAKLQPNGLLALHVSNRYMDLERVAAATALAVPGAYVVNINDIPAKVSYESAANNVVFIARSRGALATVLSWPRTKEITSSDLTPWTDDYSNIVSAIWRRLLSP